MYKNLLLLIFIPFIFTCCSRDEVQLDLFHLSLGVEAEAEIAMGIHSAEVTINSDARWIEVGIEGDFDFYTLSDNIPEWLSISSSTTLANSFKINVSAHNGTDTRIGEVSFTVFKGSRSQTGVVTIIQGPSS